MDYAISYYSRSVETTDKPVNDPIYKNDLGIVTNLIDPETASGDDRTGTEITDPDPSSDSNDDETSGARSTEAPLIDDIVEKSVILVSSSMSYITKLCFWC